MIHLLVAKKVNPVADISFYIGNIAPDAVSDEQKKAVIHLRNLPEREIALRNFALKVDNKSEYIKGFILHLFVDWKWDTVVISDFVKKHGENWSSEYGKAMITATLDTFHNTDWNYKLWEQMEQCDTFDFTETEHITINNIKSFINNRRKWQMENKAESSSLFSPNMIDKFAGDTANDFNNWISSIL